MNPDRLDTLVIALGTELDKLAANGKQLSRRTIIELAVRRAYQQGRDDEAREWLERVNSSTSATAP